VAERNRDSDAVAAAAAFEDREVVQDSGDPEVTDVATPMMRVVAVLVPMVLLDIACSLGSSGALGSSVRSRPHRDVTLRS
jgi:hypothetical protein